MLILSLSSSLCSSLFDPEAFHTGNYTKITQQCGCLFYKQKTLLLAGLDSDILFRATAYFFTTCTFTTAVAGLALFTSVTGTFTITAFTFNFTTRFIITFHNIIQNLPPNLPIIPQTKKPPWGGYLSQRFFILIIMNLFYFSLPLFYFLFCLSCVSGRGGNFVI